MKRIVLLKLSGEALAKTDGFGLDMEKVNNVAKEIKNLKDTGVSLGIVIGAGNIWRGRDANIIGMERITADHMGMLGTIFNSIALNSALEKEGLKSHVMSAIPMGDVVRPFNYQMAKKDLEHGDIIIFAGGTGHPYFSTDTTAALRALQIGADTILMAKNGTDGVYDCDPRKNPCAKRFCKITYNEILKNHLGVMDLTAATLCNDNNIQIVVFDMGVSGNIKKVINNPEIGTIITK